jgi:hypothetical protein
MVSGKSLASLVSGMAALFFVASSAYAASPMAVGQVTLVIGEGHRVAADGQKTLLRKGDSLLEGDSVQTGGAGHVHVRFVDGALVSVRPASRLAIEAYNRDAAGGAIRFKLDAGTVRSVTGKWGEENHDRFRLNTPIAAIGIRGTDFVVQAEQERVRVVVQSGAIVMAPLDGVGCQTAGLGVCKTAAAKRLSADMGDVMLELRRRQPVPEVVPLRDLLPAERLQGGDAAKNGIREHAAPTVATVSDGANAAAPMNPLQPPITLPAVVSPPHSVVSGALGGASATSSVSPPNQLVWARMYPAWLGDNLSKDFETARAGNHVTVGNASGQYLLMRTGANSDVDMRSVFASGLGRVEFSLTAGQASLLRNGGAEVATLQGGALAVDFAKRSFDASVAVMHEATGVVNIGAQGTVDQFNGMMRGGNINGEGRMVGALSPDARQAGLAFDRQTDKGLVTGITLWGR